MFRRRLPRCAKAGSCARYDPEGTVGMATVEIRGMLSSFQKSFTERLENDEQHKLKHAALGRISVLEGTLLQVAVALNDCTCGAFSEELRHLIEQVSSKTEGPDVSSDP